MSTELPVTKDTAVKGIQWLKQNYSTNISNAIKDTPFTIDTICGIFCQETLYKVALWIDHYTPDIILARCVMDASGSLPGTTRNAFPRNKEIFIAGYGNDLCNMLIDEANKMRAMPQPGFPNGYKAAQYLYFGYSIFQYDLQSIITDETFFKNKLWYNIDDCLDRCVEELMSKYHIVKTVPESIRAYNGSGERAKQYRDNVLQFITFSEQV